MVIKVLLWYFRCRLRADCDTAMIRGDGHNAGSLHSFKLKLYSGSSARDPPTMRRAISGGRAPMPYPRLPFARLALAVTLIGAAALAFAAELLPGAA
ncbi:MAG: hypothetical protein ACLFU0_00850, partial [Alphaproteobacteria bacterium]